MSDHQAIVTDFHKCPFCPLMYHDLVFTKHLSNLYYVPCTVLDTRVILVNKIRPVPLGFCYLVGMIELNKGQRDL